jgi:CheY-like chemotaxis protein
LLLTVTDTGTGMPPEIAERIFEPFFTTKGQAGTGLGLAVVHGIVRDHEGVITVASELGRGTTFRLFFPAQGAEESVVPSKPRPVRGDGEHIMYVDDEEALLMVGKRALESLGYRCTSFTDPQAVLQAFRASPEAFDAVVTDMVMPGMTGLELTRALVGIRADVPVAITSGYGDQSGAGAELVRARIQKPASVVDLSTAVRELVAREP